MRRYYIRIDTGIVVSDEHSSIKQITKKNKKLYREIVTRKVK